jgi:hypothetical protein
MALTSAINLSTSLAVTRPVGNLGGTPLSASVADDSDSAAKMGTMQIARISFMDDT